MSIDVIVAILAASGCYYGYVRGILQGLFTVLVYVLGLIGAMWFTPIVNETLRGGLGVNYWWTAVASFALTFAGAFLVLHLLKTTLEQQLNASRISAANRYGGALLLGFAFVLLGSALLKFGDQSGIIPQRVKDSSYTYRYVRGLPDGTYRAIRNVVPILRDFKGYMEQNMSPEKAKNAPESPESVPDLTPIDTIQ